MSIAANIKALRERKGLKQKDCAKRAGVAQSTWCDWESGAMSPRIDRLAVIAKALGCRVTRLVA